MHKEKVYAMIPARYGSQRLKLKNMALINGQPMISYAIQAAVQSRVFDKVVVNSEHALFAEAAKRYGAEFYQRPEELGSSQARSDDVVADFMRAFPEADAVAWVNPTSPLQTAQEVAETVRHFLAHRLDSLITVENKQVHCLHDHKPVNFREDEIFARTQDLLPVQAFVYSIMMWRAASFLEQYHKTGHAIFCGTFGVYPVSRLTSIIIKTRDDLLLADGLMKALAQSDGELRYDALVEEGQGRAGQ